jgi:hypothetical protein
MIGLSARYTYFKTDELVLTTNQEIGAEGFETDYASHDLSLGLVVRFVPDGL